MMLAIFNTYFDKWPLDWESAGGKVRWREAPVVGAK